MSSKVSCPNEPLIHRRTSQCLTGNSRYFPQHVFAYKLSLPLSRLKPDVSHCSTMYNIVQTWFFSWVHSKTLFWQIIQQSAPDYLSSPVHPDIFLKQCFRMYPREKFLKYVVVFFSSLGNVVIPTEWAVFS